MTVWIHRVEPALVTHGDGPLAGLRVAVKDNVDVAGVPTTAGCPSYSYTPTAHAPAVERLLDAGAAIVGKTNLDQFATGLVGTRSPYGVVVCPHDPERIAGGSSSGSAAAVSLGDADIGLGTDTAGSGRVPAACCRVVGVKGTRGWVPVRGVVPACPSFDCTTVFARSIAEATTAINVMAGTDPADPGSRRRPDDLRFGDVRRLGVLSDRQLDDCSDAIAGGYRHAVVRAAELGFEIVDVGSAVEPYFAAGSMLYGGAFVAERVASVGSFVAASHDDLDPSVAQILRDAMALDAASLAADTARLRELRHEAGKVFEAVDAVLMPTIPRHPTLADVEADPLGVNRAVGRFVNGCNLVDWCAIAVPFSYGLGGSVGIQLLGPAWSDDVIWRAAARLLGEPLPDRVGPRIEIAVLGAHLEGQPLHHQLRERGATLERITSTTSAYRMYALPGPVAKPGLVRVGSGGASIEVEVYSLSPAAFGDFVAEIPAPLGVGTVELVDGSSAKCFLCEPHAVVDAEDISSWRAWRAWLAT